MKNAEIKLNYHGLLRQKMDEFVHLVYTLSRGFPKEEVYGLTSQIRRAAVSVPLNYIEGYARDLSGKNLVYRNFLEISFGSLKEAEYILEFAYKEKFISRQEYESSCPLSQQIGAMLLGIIKKIKA
ncbi:MAG: four helix bundle protein [Candidatus Saccharibacteria bacterium]